MTCHTMRLQPNPFKKMRDGTKTIELRLLDEKRQRIKLGDEIEFVSRENEEEKIVTEVVGLLYYLSFKDLFEDYPPEVTGSTTKNDWKLMREHYSEENERALGVLGIRVEVK